MHRKLFIPPPFEPSTGFDAAKDVVCELLPSSHRGKLNDPATSDKRGKGEHDRSHNSKNRRERQIHSSNQPPKVCDNGDLDRRGKESFEDFEDGVQDGVGAEFDGIGGALEGKTGRFLEKTSETVE